MDILVRRCIMQTPFELFTPDQMPAIDLNDIPDRRELRRGKPNPLLLLSIDHVDAIKLTNIKHSNPSP